MQLSVRGGEGQPVADREFVGVQDLSMNQNLPLGLMYQRAGPEACP